MLGLVVLLFIGAYLLVSALVVWLAVRWARRHNRRAWVWGSLAAFAMYNLVFWDWIPTVAMHKYYCATEAGFWVYKTPEQWAKENPGVLETLSMSHLPEQFYKGQPPDAGNKSTTKDRYYILSDGTQLVARYAADNELMFVDLIKPDGSRGYWLNERIELRQLMNEPLPLSIGRWSEVLMDASTNEVLAKYVDFRSGHPNPLGSGGPNLSDLKFWLSRDHCDGGRENYGSFLTFRRNLLGDER